jgi:hypothetical protein
MKKRFIVPLRSYFSSTNESVSSVQPTDMFIIPSNSKFKHPELGPNKGSRSCTEIVGYKIAIFLSLELVLCEARVSNREKSLNKK